MDLILLLCVVFTSPVFGDEWIQNTNNPMVQFDRARSTWNFGGHPMRNRQWGRPKNIAGPSAVIANRRVGDGMRTNAWTLPSSVPNRKPSSASPSIRSRQSKPYQKPNRPKAKKQHSKFLKSSNNNRNTSIPFQSPHPPNYRGYSRPSLNTKPLVQPSGKRSALPKTMSSLRNSNRGSRMMESRADNILNRFRKEDLWHLDKGEEYEVKNEDLLLDSMLRNPYDFETSNEIFEEYETKGYEHQEHHEDEDMAHHENETPELEQNGEKFHHESMANHGAVKTAKATNTTKKEDPNKVIPVPLPRIHLPIPLGCLLAVPAFHPIRPRHHLTCLLSIPGTPNLMKRRRKRSTDERLSSPAPVQNAAQFLQMFDTNSRMATAAGGQRKHFGNHLGGGKNQHAGNLNVPATIIAPPRFDKADILKMLLGSGVVDPNEMGTVLATNGRYVRIGRGLQDGDYNMRVRGGRALWFSDFGSNSIRNPSVALPPAPVAAQFVNNPPVKTQSQQQPHQGTRVPTVNQAQSPPQLVPTPTITIHSSHLSRTPTISVTPQVQPTASVSSPQSPPLILNVQITPPAPAPVRAPPPSGPTVTVSQTQTQQQSQSPQQPSKPHTVSFSPSDKSKKNNHFKHTEYSKLVTKDFAKPQKAYSYDYDDLYNYDAYDTSESKVQYQKVKPDKKKKKAKNKSKDYKNYDHFENAQSYKDDNIDVYHYPSNHYGSSNSSPAEDSQDLGSILNHYHGNNGDSEYSGDVVDVTTAATTSWNDDANIITTATAQPVSLFDSPESQYYSNSGATIGKYYFAMKTQPEDNHNSELNNVYYNVDSVAAGDGISEGVSLTYPTGKISLPADEYYAYGTEGDNEMEGSRKYYSVKKLQAQDPIIVHVPKDRLLNEIK